MGCVPERLHLFPREEGCRGRHGEAAILTAAAAVEMVGMVLVLVVVTVNFGTSFGKATFGLNPMQWCAPISTVSTVALSNPR